MSARVVRGAGLVLSLAYASFVAWVYASQPKTVAQLTGGVAAAVGAYEVDRASFEEGRRFFRQDKFEEARAAWSRADPARQDALTQFYVAYSYYRQGWGRVYADDALYWKGLDAVHRAMAIAPSGRVQVDDPDLGMKTSDELRAELVRGTERTASDFNPLRLIRKRL